MGFEIEQNEVMIWTLNENELLTSNPGCWGAAGIQIEFIERPQNPDLTVEGLKRLLKKFINEK